MALDFKSATDVGTEHKWEFGKSPEKRFGRTYSPDVLKFL